MLRSYKTEIAPTKKQIDMILRTIGTCRYIYNFYLSHNKEIYEKEGAIYITPDGMMTTEISLKYFDSIKNDAKNKVIITGHAAKGTAGAGVLDDTYREKNQILASGEKIVFKVHMDDEDICKLCEATQTKSAVLFHSDEINIQSVKARLKKMGVQGMTLQYPEKVEVE